MTKSSSPSSTPIGMMTSYLPADFTPCENEVIIGRGRKILQHSGNVKLRSLVQLKAKDYVQTADKAVKSSIISDIAFKIRQESSQGGFVKKDNASDKWYTVSDSCARATIAQAFRDSLSPSYRSSKFSKQARRWNEKTTKQSGASSVVTFVPANTSCPVSSLGKPEQSFSGPMSLQEAMRAPKITTNPAIGLSKNILVQSLISAAGTIPSLGAKPQAVPSFQPSSMFSLTEALRTAPTTLRTTPVVSPAPSSKSETTADILQKCLDVLEDAEDEDWISYSDNPFEPIPIAEVLQEEAAKPDWWI